MTRKQIIKRLKAHGWVRQDRPGFLPVGEIFLREKNYAIVLKDTMSINDGGHTALARFTRANPKTDFALKMVLGMIEKPAQPTGVTRE